MKFIKKFFKFIWKFLKFIMWTVLILLGLVLLIVLTIPLWIGPVATSVANWKVPEITKTGFNLGEFGLNPYTGRAHLGDMQLQNPESFYTASKAKAKSFSDVKGEGFLDSAWEQTKNIGVMAGDVVSSVGDVLSSSETNAVSFTAIDVKVDVASLFSDTIHVEEIVIKDLYFYGDLTFSNIREIADNAKSFGKAPQGEEQPSPVESEPQAEPESDGQPQAEPEQPQVESEQPQAEEKKQKKVVIDRVLITGTKIQWGHFKVPLPEIEIKDIGKEEGGVDQKNVVYVIVDEICEAADKVCVGAGKALKVAIEGLDSVGDALSDGFGAVKEFAAPGVDAAKEVFSTGYDASKEALSTGYDASKEALSTGYDASKEALSTGFEATSQAFASGFDATSSAVGSGYEVSVEAVSAGAKATAEALATGAGATVDALSTGVEAIGSGVSSGFNSGVEAIGSGVDFVTGFGKSKKKKQ